MCVCVCVCVWYARPGRLVCRGVNRKITVLLEGRPAGNVDRGGEALDGGSGHTDDVIESVRWDTVDRGIVTCCLKSPSSL